MSPCGYGHGVSPCLHIGSMDTECLNVSMCDTDHVSMCPCGYGHGMS